MTCTKECSKCIYGIPKTKVKCGEPNSTCDGLCYKCKNRIEVRITWKCTANVAYGHNTKMFYE